MTNKSTPSICAFLILGGFCSFAKAAPFQFSAGVSVNQKELLERDFAFLGSIQFEDRPDSRLKQYLNVGNLNSQAVQDWLKIRVHYIVSPDSRKRLLTQEGQPFVSGNQNAPKVYFPELPSLVEPYGGSTIIFNMGANIYEIAKAEHKPLVVEIEGLDNILVLSPRVGIVEFGKAFFQPLDPSWPESRITDRLHTLFRLESLLHEARHSDGNGPSLTFRHQTCPKGHDYEGLPACDAADNGAYGIGAEFLQEVLRVCSDCQESETDLLKILLADDLNRLLTRLGPNDEKEDSPWIQGQTEDRGQVEAADPNTVNPKTMKPKTVIWDPRAEGFKQ